jgi:hypothetical protein
MESQWLPGEIQVTDRLAGRGRSGVRSAAARNERAEGKGRMETFLRDGAD